MLQAIQNDAATTQTPQRERESVRPKTESATKHVVAVQETYQNHRQNAKVRVYATFSERQTEPLCNHRHGIESILLILHITFFRLSICSQYAFGTITQYNATETDPQKRTNKSAQHRSAVRQPSQQQAIIHFEFVSGATEENRMGKRKVKETFARNSAFDVLEQHSGTLDVALQHQEEDAEEP